MSSLRPPRLCGEPFRYCVFPLRNADASEFFESFLISAGAALLLSRGFLYLTAYPRVGGDSLHIAHMLWGGLMMLAAIVLVLAHMLLVPGLIAALIGAHLYLVAKLGTTAPPWLKAEKKDLFREEV